MNKKYLILIGAVAVIVLIFLIYMWISLAKPQPAGTTRPLLSFFPFVPSGTGQAPAPAAPAVPPTISALPGHQLVQLTKNAVSGATFAIKTKDDKTKIAVARYIEKSTGNIYDIEPQGANLTRVSNVTIARIFETYWSNDGERVVVRYPETNQSGPGDTIRNFSIISASSSQGVFLSSAITSLVSSPSESKIFYLANFENQSIGIISSFEDKNKKQIFSTPFQEFQASWPNKNFISLNSAASASASGFLYKLNISDGSLENILANIKGLTSLWSADGTKIIYSESGFQNVKTNIYLLKDKISSALPLVTLPEKCEWSKIYSDILYCSVPNSLPAADYPDDWYRGAVSFSDMIWKINTASGTTEALLPGQNNLDIDAINLRLDNKENYLLFQNKKDGVLWSLQI